MKRKKRKKEGRRERSREETRVETFLSVRVSSTGLVSFSHPRRAHSLSPPISRRSPNQSLKSWDVNGTCSRIGSGQLPILRHKRSSCALAFETKRTVESVEFVFKNSSISNLDNWDSRENASPSRVKINLLFFFLLFFFFTDTLH